MTVMGTNGIYRRHTLWRGGRLIVFDPRFVIQHTRTGEYLDAAGQVVPVLDDAAQLGTVVEASEAIERQDCRGACVVRQVA